MVELVDSLDSGSSVHCGRAGSSPASPTNLFFLNLTLYGRVVELVDSLDSGSSVHCGRAGSSPASPTKEAHPTGCASFFALLAWDKMEIMCHKLLNIHKHIQIRAVYVLQIGGISAILTA